MVTALLLMCAGLQPKPTGEQRVVPFDGTTVLMREREQWVYVQKSTGRDPSRYDIEMILQGDSQRFDRPRRYKSYFSGENTSKFYRGFKNKYMRLFESEVEQDPKTCALTVTSAGKALNHMEEQPSRKTPYLLLAGEIKPKIGDHGKFGSALRDLEFVRMETVTVPAGRFECAVFWQAYGEGNKFTIETIWFNSMINAEVKSKIETVQFSSESVLESTTMTKF